jgi:hypothetical protein
VDVRRAVLTRDAKPIYLSAREFQLLRYFIQRAGEDFPGDCQCADSQFFLGKMGGAIGFEFWGRRSFNNIENTAGTVRAVEGNGKQC